MAFRITVILFVLGAIFAACVKEKPAPDGAAAVTDGSGTTCANPGPKGYLEACQVDDECMSCECFSFGHSIVCTTVCDGPEDCPAPSQGCFMNRCRP